MIGLARSVSCSSVTSRMVKPPPFDIALEMLICMPGKKPSSSQLPVERVMVSLLVSVALLDPFFRTPPSTSTSVLPLIASIS